MSMVAIFTDASRIPLDDQDYRAAYGWVAVDFHDPLKSIIAPEVVPMTQNPRSSVAAEVLAVLSAARAYQHMSEVYIFTDSLYTAMQVEKARELEDARRRPLRVLPEAIAEIASMTNVHVHHVRAHRSVFFNELVDHMVGMVAREEMETEEAKTWARQASRRGVLEISIGKADKPKYVRRSHERNTALLSSVQK